MAAGPNFATGPSNFLALAVLNAAIGAAELPPVEGAPARAIPDEFVCPFRVLIVMGGSAFSATSKLFGSSIVHQVVARAACPVITIPPPPDEAPVDDSGRRVAELEMGEVA